MSLPTKHLSFYTFQRETVGRDMTPRDIWAAAWDAATRAAYANENRRTPIPHECDCTDGRCKARMVDGFEHMGELA